MLLSVQQDLSSRQKKAWESLDAAFSHKPCPWVMPANRRPMKRLLQTLSLPGLYEYLPLRKKYDGSSHSVLGFHCCLGMHFICTRSTSHLLTGTASPDEAELLPVPVRAGSWKQLLT